MIENLKIEIADGLVLSDETIRLKINHLNSTLKPLVDKINEQSIKVSMYIRNDNQIGGYNITLPDDCPQYLVDHVGRLLSQGKP